MPEQSMIRADSALSHMIWNLMENAIKHNPKKKKHLWIHGKSTRKSFALSIADNGPGLENGMKVQLFDPRRRYGGVGLHLVHRLAEKYGAKVKVDNRVKSQPGKGLKVTVTFQMAG